jgi:DNA-binding transcriptional ArsR family regulator
MTDGARRLVVGPASVRLRRELGPTTWVVLEELLARSDGTADSCSASVSVRSLASELGLAKDTVARALSRLRRAGIVSACQTRSTSGAFAAGSYLIAVPETLTIDDDATAVAETKPTRRRSATSQSARVRRDAPQLALTLD